MKIGRRRFFGAMLGSAVAVVAAVYAPSVLDDQDYGREFDDMVARARQRMKTDPDAHIPPRGVRYWMDHGSYEEMQLM